MLKMPITLEAKTTVLVGLLLTICVINSRSFAQESSYPCEASPGVAQALAVLPYADDSRLTWAERVGPVRALMKEYPNDLFVHLRYQDMIGRDYFMADEYDSALALYRSMPDRTLGQYLEARLLWKSQVRKSRETLNHLLETVPQFPWPHLALLEMMDFPGYTDRTGAEDHVRAFLKACPNSLEAYSHFGHVDDAEMIRTAAAQLRQLLSPAPTRLYARYYPGLWELEFRAAPKNSMIKCGNGFATT